MTKPRDTTPARALIDNGRFAVTAPKESPRFPSSQPRKQCPHCDADMPGRHYLTCWSLKP
jgi:hypothetical protein